MRVWPTSTVHTLRKHQNLSLHLKYEAVPPKNKLVESNTWKILFTEYVYTAPRVDRYAADIPTYQHESHARSVFPETLFITNKSHLHFSPHMHTQKNALDNAAVSVFVSLPSIPHLCARYLITGWSGPRATCVSPVRPGRFCRNRLAGARLLGPELLPWAKSPGKHV